LPKEKQTKRNGTPVRLPLRGFPRHALLDTTALHGTSCAGLHWNEHPCSFLPVAASFLGIFKEVVKGESRARAKWIPDNAIRISGMTFVLLFAFPG